MSARNTFYLTKQTGEIGVWYDEHKTENTVCYTTFQSRVLRNGWDLERAISTPVTTHQRNKEVNK